MTRTNTKEAKNGDALVKTSAVQSVQLASAIDVPDDWCSELLDGEEIAVTGTEEMGREDVKLPAWLLNSRKEDVESGRQAADDVFWNTVTERTKDVLRLQILTNHKSKIWREENASNELVVRCSSWDSKTGRMEDDSTRPCAGCPDAAWYRRDDGRRTRRCTDVNNLVALDRDTGEVCVIKVKTTAVKGWRQYYQAVFHNKRRSKVAGRPRIADIPFFAAETVVTAAKMQGGGYTWYVPQFAFGGALPLEEIRAAAEFVRDQIGAYLDRAEKSADVEPDVNPASSTIGSGGSGGGMIDSEEFVDDFDGDANEDLAPPTGAGSPAKRF